MNDSQARLVVKQGPSPNQEFTLTKATSILGRSQTVDIPISDPEVSRQHARIVVQGTGYAVEDLGSTNGTFVNGQPVFALTPLKDGDLIRLGDTIQLAFSHRQLSAPAYGDEQPTSPELAAPPPLQPAAAPMFEESSAADDFGALPAPRSNRRRWILGCGCGFLLAIFLCTSLVFFLDSYDQGRLLYCGPLQTFWETILGPFGFAPACAIP